MKQPNRSGKWGKMGDRVGFRSGAKMTEQNNKSTNVNYRLFGKISWPNLRALTMLPTNLSSRLTKSASAAAKRAGTWGMESPICTFIAAMTAETPGRRIPPLFSAESPITANRRYVLHVAEFVRIRAHRRILRNSATKLRFNARLSDNGTYRPGA